LGELQGEVAGVGQLGQGGSGSLLGGGELV
jgi:hypothetical protein